MKKSFGDTLAALRQTKKLTQRVLADKVTAYGFETSARTVYNWEKDNSLPSIHQFLALCDILDVDDILWRFAGKHKGPYAGLNDAGRQKVREHIALLFHIDEYRDDPEDHTDTPKLLRLYDIPVSAGTGSLLDESGYEMIEAPSYVASSADFALRVSGDSMEPLYRDGQIIWVCEQPTLNSGEIGIFYYSDSVYCKKLISGATGTYLRSLNPEYEDIEINDELAFKVIGKVVS